MFELPGYSDFHQIGAGGMAVVYQATQISFKRPVAVKVLQAAYATDPDFAQRFLREAEIVASLSHPHIIPVYDFGQRNGTFYMVMDYLTGGDLLQLIHRGLEIDQVLQIISDIASALHFVHEKGYVHRDVKPDNIMFREDKSAVLTDFGIARLCNANDQVTIAGSVLGTPKYMSPEQLQGHAIDGRSDLYSLGVMFYEMLTKQAPYQDEEFMVLAMKHLQAPIPKLPLVFVQYQRLFEKMVAKKPENRFQTGLEIVKLIQQLHSGQMHALENVDVASALSTRSVSAAMHRLKEKTSAAMEAQVPKVREGLQSGEAPPKGILFKSYTYEGRIVALDWMRLSMNLSTFNNNLLEWYQERGSKCGSIELEVVTVSDLFDKVQQAIRQWQDNPAGKFLKKLGVKLVLVDVETDVAEKIRVK